MSLRADYVPRSEHQELFSKYETAERDLEEHGELLKKCKELQDKIKQLEQEKETLWLQANPDLFS
jgi:uncharacterized protein YaaN involved in tellurite resistance